MPNRDNNEIFWGVGRRLALVRRVAGLTQTAIAQRLNMSATRWNNYELGVSLMPVAEALKLKRLVPGISIDWIYDGDRSSLRMDIANGLEAAERDGEPVIKKRGRPPRRS